MLITNNEDLDETAAQNLEDLPSFETIMTHDELWNYRGKSILNLGIWQFIREKYSKLKWLIYAIYII